MRKLIYYFLVFVVSYSYGQQQPPNDLDGEDLRVWLKANWYNAKFSNQGYNAARRAMYGTIDVESDGSVYCVYTGFNQTSRVTTFLNPINAEHSIPQSWFDADEPMRSDIFHLYPTHGSVNSARSNKPFNENIDNTTNTWYTGSAAGLSTQSSIPSTNIDDYSENRSDGFEPREDHKGDLARAVFYFFTMYDISNYNGKTLNSAILGGNVDILYQWHLEDPVDEWEQQRNERIEDVQGNRNPYIDYPDLACRAWGYECSGATSPILLVEEDIKTFGPIDVGQSTPAQSYSLSATNLQSAINISASSSFEVSIDNTNFSTSTSLMPASDGSVGERLIYVRFTPATNQNDTIKGQLIHVWDGTEKRVDLIGLEKKDVILDGINIDENLSHFGNIAFGENSQSQSYFVSGGALSGNINITASANFELSLDDSDFTTALTLPRVADEIEATQVFVRFKPLADTNDNIEGTIKHNSSGYNEEIISISGTEFEERIPLFSFELEKDSINDFSDYSLKVLADEEMNQSVTLTLVLANASNISYGTNGFITDPPIENGLLKLTLDEFDVTGEIQFSFNPGLDISNDFQIDLTMLSGSGYVIGDKNRFRLVNNDFQVLSLKHQQFEIYPNPASYVIYLPEDIAFSEVRLFDLSGNEIPFRYIENEHALAINHIKEGVYFITLTNNLGFSSRKIIISRE